MKKRRGRGGGGGLLAIGLGALLVMKKGGATDGEVAKACGDQLEDLKDPMRKTLQTAWLADGPIAAKVLRSAADQFEAYDSKTLGPLIKCLRARAAQQEKGENKPGPAPLGLTDSFSMFDVPAPSFTPPMVVPAAPSSADMPGLPLDLLMRK